ncbi:hypothetical protein A3D80_01845 [Candidatus Roizmanbacteria bacterium RIFCSPHIGHO2_02_FULL_40_13b]|uniref:HTH cro/C1-type domain-containing protein n=1 Tax=Candidatus Roizmanbacteria bacterium RIFCSPHIGHO2_01_FULL_39_24 TaxID=1802032 RepID=A0A1F7GL81_9BACT|nr:MAG: hypothetical protein A2799_01585 [Candidatus Roizmanbacteria bacterium RIFCSPHIGHO2_01_FULL_39_24]OGK27832.1 MAG: hypothetical protein A3D80_01845 [Candidatus Roizmanbacteria bacterium RIFCSPHIGHO2_02_FULL_40_13b]OGK49974.1 MAG: hypothetical protein A3A56_03005 [Candidatus Roizmanbacteria bacterium RIFCSPLOWO2_01_FULL_40_32]OGK55979.1 MAG: hypothetical protein A3H83_02800 [Candidatus Roizmanbacteria bacterium RIFCSPLOWO2_02_FULL_39_8]
MKYTSPLTQLTDQLTRKRKDLGISKKELAREAQTGEAIITRLERGNLNPSIRLLQSIARAMNTHFTINFQR